MLMTIVTALAERIRALSYDRLPEAAVNGRRSAFSTPSG
jgi:hypothetical protein